MSSYTNIKATVGNLFQKKLCCICRKFLDTLTAINKSLIQTNKRKRNRNRNRNVSLLAAERYGASAHWLDIFWCPQSPQLKILYIFMKVLNKLNIKHSKYKFMSLFMYSWPQSIHYCSHLLNILCLLFVIGFYPQHCSIFNLLTCSL